MNETPLIRQSSDHPDLAGADTEALPIETSPNRVRAVLAGHVVADSSRPLLVWEPPHHPAYYFPHQEVRTQLIGPAERTEHRTGLGEAHLEQITRRGWIRRTTPVLMRTNRGTACPL